MNNMALYMHFALGPSGNKKAEDMQLVRMRVVPSPSPLNLEEFRIVLDVDGRVPVNNWVIDGNSYAANLSYATEAAC